MFKPKGVMFLTLVFMLLPAHSLFTQPSNNKICDSPEHLNGYKDFIIDAVTKATTGSRRYKIDQNVRIVLKNMNPFRFQYQIKINTIALEEPALKAFLSTMLFADKIVLKEEPTKEPPEEELKERRTLIVRKDPCQLEINTMFEKFKKENKYMNTLFKELNNSGNKMKKLLGCIIEKQASVVESFSILQKETNKIDATCSILEEKANEFKGKFETYDKAHPSESFDKLTTINNDMQKKLRVQNAYIEVFKNQLSEKCREQVEKNIDIYKYLHQVERLEIISGNTLKQLNKAKENYKNCLAMKNGIDEIYMNKSFNMTRIIDYYPDRREVTVEITRRDLTKGDKAKFESYTTEKLLFGGRPFFALAGGVGFSSLDNREFEIVQGIPDNQSPADGESSLTNLVGYKENSSYRTVPLVVLHTRLMELPRIFNALHASFGITSKVDNQGRDVEYLVGLSLSFAGERFFVTVGGYSGLLQELEGNFEVGDPIPEDLAKLPIRKDRHWAWIITFSYKIK